MKLEQNDKALLFSETQIPDIFFAEHLSELPGDYLKIYMYMIFLSKYSKDIKLNDLSKKLNVPLKQVNDGIKFLEEHSNFKIYTKSNTYKATVFSFYSIGIDEEENNIKLLDVNKEIEYYKRKSNYDIGEVKKVVKLSTCSYLSNHTTPTNQRYYLIAKLEKI